MKFLFIYTVFSASTIKNVGSTKQHLKTLINGADPNRDLQDSCKLNKLFILMLTHLKELPYFKARLDGLNI